MNAGPPFEHLTAIRGYEALQYPRLPSKVGKLSPNAAKGAKGIPYISKNPISFRQTLGPQHHRKGWNPYHSQPYTEAFLQFPIFITFHHPTNRNSLQHFRINLLQHNEFYKFFIYSVYVLVFWVFTARLVSFWVSQRMSFPSYPSTRNLTAFQLQSRRWLANVRRLFSAESSLISLSSRVASPHFKLHGTVNNPSFRWNKVIRLTLCCTRENDDTQKLKNQFSWV